MKVYLETMGCQMNQLDSELVASSLRRAGHEFVERARDADAVIYNTCSVREHAETKALSRLGAAGQRRAGGRRQVVAVIGCMAQRMGAELIEQYGADVVCGPGQLHRLGGMIEEAAQTPTENNIRSLRSRLADGAAGDDRPTEDETRGCSAAPRKPRHPAPGATTAANTAAVAPNFLALDAERVAGADDGDAEAMEAFDAGRDPQAGQTPSSAFVRVMHGCDVFCTYCIVPLVRGAQRSRRPEAIVEEVRRLAGAGRSEITLLGQIVNAYCYEAGETTVRFADLLERVAAVDGVRRLRFVTSHPLEFGDEILAAMARLENVCRYMHCPAQSGADAVLKRMNRRYSRAEYDELIERARAMVPGIVLAGDFIVGFPGETEADHESSAELIRRAGYKNSFVFKYSPRPGTPAARTLADDVPGSVKKRRNNELLAVQAEVSAAHMAGYVGQSVEVLVTGPSARAGKQAKAATAECTQMQGRTRGDHIVVLDGPVSLAGQYVQARITGCTPLTLFGEME